MSMFDAMYVGESAVAQVLSKPWFSKNLFNFDAVHIANQAVSN